MFMRFKKKLGQHFRTINHIIFVQYSYNEGIVCKLKNN